MRVVSVQIGSPRTVTWHGKTVETGIWKEPVAGRVAVARHNLAGDRQADLSVHGGPDKAVYAYPAEHYPWWRERLPGVELGWGAFGENLTVAGLHEDHVFIGDRFRIGTAEFSVTQPRMPCFKLGIKFDRPEIVKEFLRSGRSGFYFAIVREGELGAGDAIELVQRADASLTVTDVVRLYVSDAPDRNLLRRASELSGLPAGWREEFRERLLQASS
jgi:MOSC domain-containing protein YiiM